MELTPFFFGLYKFVKYGLHPLTWVVLLLVAATILALFPFSPTRLRWVRQLIISSLLLLVTSSSPWIAYPLIGSLESWYHPPQLTPSDRFDAIVVLGEASMRRARFDRPSSRIPLQEIEPPAVWTSTSRLCPHIGADRGRRQSFRHGAADSDRNETMGGSPRRSRVRH